MPRPPLPVGTAGRVNFLTMPNGQIRARATFRDYDGVTRPVTRYGPSKAAAERRLKEALRDRRGPSGDGRITGETRVRDVAATWLTEISDSGLAEGSVETYTRTLNRHVIAGLGGLQVREVDVPAVDRFLKAVRSKHGTSAAKNAKTVVSLILGLAVRHGAMPSNPVRDVEKIKRTSRKQSVRALTVEEAIDLVKRVDAEAGTSTSRPADEADLGDVVRFMLGTGTRIGEALAVRRSVVDLEAGVVEVNATVVRIKGKGAVLQQRTKSDAGWRVIAVPDDVVELLRRRMAMSWPRNEHGLVFPTLMGAVRSPVNVQRGLRSVLTRIDADEWAWVTSHVFRKTVATRLDEAGLSARAIADHLGHARPSMTQDVYMGRGVASAEAATVLGRVK